MSNPSGSTNSYFGFAGTCVCQTILVAGSDEVAEERVGLQRLGLEFGMKLAAEEERVIGDFYDLDIGCIGGGSGEAKSAAGEEGFVFAVELVAMAMALADLSLGVGFGC